MSTRAADDFAEIRRNRIRLTRICYRKLDLPTTECWCMKAGPNGEDIPCSEARDPTPWERVELGKPEKASELTGALPVWMHTPHCASWDGHRCDCVPTASYKTPETASELAAPIPVSNLGRPLPNHCEKHGVVWGDGEHEGCGACADSLRTPDVVLSHIGDCAVWDGRDCDCGSTVRMPECVTYG